VASPRHLAPRCLKGVTSSASVTYLPATDAALRKAGKAAVALEGFPIPHCADPHGYWKSILARVKAAGHEAEPGRLLSLRQASRKVRRITLPEFWELIRTARQGTVAA